MLQQLGRSPLNFLALLQGARALQGQPMMADEGDEAFLRRYQQQGFEGQPFNQPAAQQVMPNTAIADIPQPAQRERVSPLNVLGRVLAPRTFQALDTERTRLQAEADRPAQQARLAQVLGRIPDPIEQAIFLGLGSDEWRENSAKNYAPISAAEGTAVVTPARGVVYNNRRTREFGDSLVRDTDNGYEVLGTRGPTISERNTANRTDADIRIANARLGLDEREFLDSVRNADRNYEIAAGRYGLDVSEARREAEAAARTQAGQTDATEGQLNQIESALGRARGFINSAGYWNGRAPILSQINAQDRANLTGNLDTLKGNLTFDKLMEMKANSPNGASGLGALSDYEARLLSSVVTSLNEDMSPQQLQQSFDQIDDLIARGRQRVAQQRGRPSSVGSTPPLPPGFQLD